MALPNEQTNKLKLKKRIDIFQIKHRYFRNCKNLTIFKLRNCVQDFLRNYPDESETHLTFKDKLATFFSIRIHNNSYDEAVAAFGLCFLIFL